MLCKNIGVVLEDIEGSKHLAGRQVLVASQDFSSSQVQVKNAPFPAPTANTQSRNANPNPMRRASAFHVATPAPQTPTPQTPASRTPAPNRSQDTNKDANPQLCKYPPRAPARRNPPRQTFNSTIFTPPLPQVGAEAPAEAPADPSPSAAAPAPAVAAPDATPAAPAPAPASAAAAHSAAFPEQHQQTQIPNLAQYVTVNGGLALFAQVAVCHL